MLKVPLARARPNFRASFEKFYSTTNSKLWRTVSWVATPNPSSKKLLSDFNDTTFTGINGASFMLEFMRGKEFLGSSVARILAEGVFEKFPEISKVDVANDFLVCSIEEEEPNWNEVAHLVETLINSEDSFLLENATKAESALMIADFSELEQEILEVIDEKVKPVLQADGGDIMFKGFDSKTGKVKVRLIGACAGCPSSTVTMNFMVKNLLTSLFEEVTEVEQVFEEIDLASRQGNWIG